MDGGFMREGTDSLPPPAAEVTSGSKTMNVPGSTHKWPAPSHNANSVTHAQSVG